MSRLHNSTVQAGIGALQISFPKMHSHFEDAIKILEEKKMCHKSWKFEVEWISGHNNIPRAANYTLLLQWNWLTAQHIFKWCFESRVLQGVGYTNNEADTVFGKRRRVKAIIISNVPILWEVHYTQNCVITCGRIYRITTHFKSCIQHAVILQLWLLSGVSDFGM